MTYEREPWEFEEAKRARRRTGSTTAVSGRYVGPEPTATERSSGVVVEIDQQGPLRRGSVGHRALTAFRDGGRLTAYEASRRMTGDYHSLRREATRLLTRGLLVKDGVLPNEAPRGRPHVDAYRLTDAGRAELARLGEWSAS